MNGDYGGRQRRWFIAFLLFLCFESSMQDCWRELQAREGRRPLIPLHGRSKTEFACYFCSLQGLQKAFSSHQRSRLVSCDPAAPENAHEVWAVSQTDGDFSYGKFGLLSPGKVSCYRVALPNLRCMLGVLVCS